MSLPLPSTFMPLPLAIMIPFMGMQSMVMAKQFGEGFQYGKRRISAMSNEEFNQLTMEKLMQQTNSELKKMIPDMAQSLREMRPFQREIFIEMLAALKEAIGLGIDVGKAGLGINTNLPSVDPNKFQPGAEEIARGYVPSPPTQTPTRSAPISPSGIDYPPAGVLQTATDLGTWQTLITIAKLAKRYNTIIATTTSDAARRRASTNLTQAMLDYHKTTNKLILKYQQKIRPYINYWNEFIVNI